jgi:2'-5' RNA ligase
MKRLFIAINILPNDALLKVYNDLQSRCSKGKIKWVDAGLFHLTLKFLGETPENDVKKIAEGLCTVANSYNPFTFNLKGIGIFGSSYRPRIIRVNIDKGEQLIGLGNKIRQKLEQMGFPNDRQNFVPHLTLGRVKKVQDKAFFQKSINLYKENHFQQVRVSEILLYESILYPDGPEYVILERCKLLQEAIN